MSETLDHAAIAGLIPHAGRMCLLARVDAWDAQRIRCSATSHRESDNPCAAPAACWPAPRSSTRHRPPPCTAR
ncbi:hypothetical protein [Ramlibacter montanisoli]|uniref:hypothetical protein n=1 Tax=Ramlibacter montanisoli TaxID=2732512 RepID=UPI002814ACC8|nr:hypothetical protein [Ramlibacter montanisoli]